MRGLIATAALFAGVQAAIDPIVIKVGCTLFHLCPIRELTCDV